MKYIKTYPLVDDKALGDRPVVHLEGIGDAYTLCGFDTAGDHTIHGKPPKTLHGNHRITCPQCLQVIELVKDYQFEKQRKGK